MRSVEGKIVAITGGGSGMQSPSPVFPSIRLCSMQILTIDTGIGLAFARACHAKGARVVIADLKLTAEGDAFLTEAGEANVVFQKTDVTNWADLHAVISASVEHFGRVPDVYAPVAGIYEPAFSNFWDDGEDDGYKTIRINVEHPIKFARLGMRALAGAEKQGVVMMVSSTAGIRATYLASLYTASKHAIVGFAKAMGQADPDLGVRISCIMPGMVSSPLWHDRDDEMKVWGKYEGRKGLETGEVAECMVRMVEDERGAFEGGTCVLKTPFEEKVQEEGWRVLRERYRSVYDPSPRWVDSFRFVVLMVAGQVGEREWDVFADVSTRPEPDLTRITNAFAKERGRKWT